MRYDSTTNRNLTTAWTLLAVANIPVCIQRIAGGTVIYTFSEDEPDAAGDQATAIDGHLLRNDQPLELIASNPIWARSQGAATLKVSLGVATADVGTSLGNKSDAAATDSTSSWSLVSIAKGIWQAIKDMSAKLPVSLGIKTAANSLSMAPASDAKFASVIYDANGNPVNMAAEVPVINTSGYPQGATPLFVVATGANTIATASLPGVLGKTTYLSGFIIESLGATSGSIKNPSIAGLTGGLTMSMILQVVAGATTPNTRIAQNFLRDIPATAAGTAIDVSCPALGLGNSSSIVIAWGYQK